MSLTCWSNRSYDHWSLVPSNAISMINYLVADFWSVNGHPQVVGYPLMSTPWNLLALVASYLYLVLSLGPQLMKDRRPFQLKWIIRRYNLAMAVFNWLFFLATFYVTDFGRDTWRCPTGPPPPDAEAIILLGWVFVLSRIVEFLDTAFFVLRKKSSHVSFLHVFHHSVVPVTVWFVLKLSPKTHYGFVPLINSLVHTVMYLYYALSTFDLSQSPALAKRFLWWKQQLTRIQIGQFVLVIFNSCRVVFIPDCHLSSSYMTLMVTALVFTSVILGLFVSFYNNTYHRRSKNKKLA